MLRGRKGFELAVGRDERFGEWSRSSVAAVGACTAGGAGAKGGSRGGKSSDEALGSVGGVTDRDVTGVAGRLALEPGSGDDVTLVSCLDPLDDAVVVVTGDSLRRDVPDVRADENECLAVRRSSRGGRAGGEATDTKVCLSESSGTGERGEVPATGDRELK